MKRAALAVLLAVALVATAGCAGSAKQAALKTAPTPSALPQIAARTFGLRLGAVPAGYRPPISAHAVLVRFGRLHTDDAGTGTARLRTVNGAYPAWVITSRAHGNESVAVYDLRGRRWTMSFHLPLHVVAPSCRSGFCGFPVNQGALDVIAGYAERVAGDAHVFAGDRVDDAADQVDVYLVHAPRSVIDALNAAHPGTYVIHNDVAHTLSAVTAVERGLDFTALQSRGIDIVSAGPNGEGRLVVGVTKDIPKAQAYFDATYGRGFARVVHGEPAEATPAIGPVIDPNNAHLLTRAQIEAQNSGKGVTVAAVLVTYGQAHSLAPDLAGASVADPSRKVWLVTDYYDPPRREVRDGGWGPPSSNLSPKVTSRHDSSVVDAATGTQMAACQGCAVVPESNANWPVAGRPTVSRAQALADARREFATRDVRLQLVWEGEGIESADLVWRAYASHARTTLISQGPDAANVVYRGPALMWLGATGAPPAGFATIRPLRGHHILPLESPYISVSLVQALGKHGFRIALPNSDSPRVRPTIDRLRALAIAGGAEHARHIWLVDLFEPERVRLSWLVALRNGSYAFVDAATGKRFATTR